MPQDKKPRFAQCSGVTAKGKRCQNILATCSEDEHKQPPLQYCRLHFPDSIKCAAFTKEGKKCRNFPAAGKSCCWVHRDHEDSKIGEKNLPELKKDLDDIQGKIKKIAASAGDIKEVAKGLRTVAEELTTAAEGLERVMESLRL